MNFHQNFLLLCLLMMQLAGTWRHHKKKLQKMKLLLTLNFIFLRFFLKKSLQSFIMRFEETKKKALTGKTNKSFY